MDIEKKKNLILESIKKINKIIANENKEFSKSKLTIEEVSCIWVINKQFYDDIIKGNFKSLRGIFCFDKNVAEYFKKIGFVVISPSENLRRLSVNYWIGFGPPKIRKKIREEN